MASNAENVSIWWRHHAPKIVKEIMQKINKDQHPLQVTQQALSCLLFLSYKMFSLTVKNLPGNKYFTGTTNGNMLSKEDTWRV